MEAHSPVAAVLVGAGNRSLVYAQYAQKHPENLQIVGVADPREIRRRHVADMYDIPEDRCFNSAEDLASVPSFADVAINGTLDHLHVQTSLPLLEAGYDLLLEKPIATSTDDMWDLIDAAEQYESNVVICHVLRYTPFYKTIRKKVLSGAIGDIVNIQTTEHVSYHHMAVSYVRGKWSKRSFSRSSMLMAKCCHDLDVIAWMKSGVAPKRVSSFGSNQQFRPERAPEGAGTRCLVDCEIEDECLYSARKHYIDHPYRWSFYVWEDLEGVDNPTIEQKIESLKCNNPYGRCVWKCDTEVVDHQSVMIEFEDGTTATHNMVGGAARPSRSIHILGTEGEIEGIFEDSKIIVRCIDPRPGHEYTEDEITLDVSGDMHGAFGSHGGGDMALMEDFVHVVRGEPQSISTTAITDSIYGHLIGFCADEAMEQNRVVEIPEPRIPKEETIPVEDPSRLLMPQYMH